MAAFGFRSQWGHGGVTVRPRWGHGGVTVRSRCGHDAVTVRSRRRRARRARSMKRLLRSLRQSVTQCARTRARTRACTRTRTHAHTHAHAHTPCSRYQGSRSARGRDSGPGPAAPTHCRRPPPTAGGRGGGWGLSSALFRQNVVHRARRAPSARQEALRRTIKRVLNCFSCPYLFMVLNAIRAAGSPPEPA